MSPTYALNLAGNILWQTWMVPWVPYATVLGVLLLVAAATAKQTWLQVLVAAIFLCASAAYSVWVLPVGVILAAFGLVLIVAGIAWRFKDRMRYGGLVWPGVGLALAPLANIYVVMPVLRSTLG